MPLKQSEAIVLRTYPLHEADLLVTLFTRLEGKLKGVAKAAKKSRRRFAGALEPLTCVRVLWEDRERRELARIDSCEVLASPLSSQVDYPRIVALGHVAEMLDEMLPEREANDAIYRLADLGAGEFEFECHLDAGDVLPALDGAADGVSSGAERLHRLRARTGWAEGLVSCAGRWLDVRGA